ncbi:MAG: SdpI family protein [Bacteroidetes bacterium]|nr:SdpI family protein [Fibrella sp.]
MKKNPIYSEPAMIAVLCLPFVYLLLIWNQLPATIPGHYGPTGQPDRYDSKELLLAAFGLGSVLMYSLRFLPHLDPKRNLLGSTFLKIRLLINLFWSAFLGWFWYVSLHGIEPDSLITTVLIGTNLLLAGIGNLMYTLKPSFFVGIRTPWTLSNDTVWRKTHHLAGWLWVTGGLAGAVLVWLLPIDAKMPVSLGVTGLLVLIPAVYSYWVYRKVATITTP